jgi:hypothetical protein
MGKKPRPRSQRREAEREEAKLVAARERLFELEPGGSAARPLFVQSPAVIDVHSDSVPCPRCGGRHVLEEHLALVVSGVRLRQAQLCCRQCGTRRALWFRLAELGPN